MYFVGDDNKAYYSSNAFGKILAFLQGNPYRCTLKEVNSRRLMIIDSVPNVSEALGIMEKIEAEKPI